jgi:hypothetical protein
MRVAAATDIGESCPLSGPVSPADLARTGERRLRIRHTSRRRREGPLAVARAIRSGHARARTQAGWLDDVVQHPAMLTRRGDFQARAYRLAVRLAAWADWETMLTRPTWAVLMAETGMARSTLASYLAWFRRVGLLGLVAGGTTPDLSPGILAGQDGQDPRNEAAVYVLCAPRALRLVAVARPEDVGAEHVHDGRDWPTDPVTGAPLADAVVDPATGEILDPHDHHAEPGPEPRQDSHQPRPPQPVDRTRTPTPSLGGCSPRTRARHHDPSGAGLRPALTGLLPMRPAHDRDTPDEAAWPLTATPAGRKERLAVAAALQAALPLLRRISTAHVAHLAREWFLAGWTPADVLAALGRRPDGTPWCYSDDIRHVPGWWRHRLTAWRQDPADPAGPVTRSPGARAAADAAHQRAAARARSQRLAAEAAAVAGADRAAVRARADAVRAAHRARWPRRHR